MQVSFIIKSIHDFEVYNTREILLNCVRKFTKTIVWVSEKGAALLIELCPIDGGTF